MSDLPRRAVVTVLGAGAFVGFEQFAENGVTDGTGSGNQTATDEPDIQLDNDTLEVDSDTVTVEVDAANYGDSEGTATVEFRDQVETLEEKSVSLDAGAVESLEFSRDYLDIEEEDVDLVIINEELPLAVDLNLPRSDIQFNDAQIVDEDGEEIEEIEEGETFFVEGVAENVGDRPGDKTYVLFGDDEELDDESVNSIQATIPTSNLNTLSKISISTRTRTAKRSTSVSTKRE